MDATAMKKRQEAMGMMLANATIPEKPATGRCTDVMVRCHLLTHSISPQLLHTRRRNAMPRQ